MKKIKEITDWLMKDYVEGNIPEMMMRQWTEQIVARDYEQFLKEYETQND